MLDGGRGGPEGGESGGLRPRLSTGGRGGGAKSAVTEVSRAPLPVVWATVTIAGRNRHETVIGRGYRGACRWRSGDRLSLETSMFKIFATALVATVAAASLGVQARAADITGAGATFPQPIYNKWAE